jgi:penicillin V acylase-like amidase (Ntn superfamily)
MKTVEQSVLALAILLITGSRVPACTVLFVCDGKAALAGSNEDWADPNTQMWYVPATKDAYGILYFGFGKGEYPEDGVSSRKLTIPEGGITEINPEDLYGLPQGGMNEKGLFFDGAATDVIQASPALGKKLYEGRLEHLILRKCATVDEALELLETYAFNLVQGQWMFADRTGDSFIVEAGDAIVRKKGNYQVMTNFRQSTIEPEGTCPRYTLVTQSLAERKDPSVDLVRSLLKATSQKFTAYSTIFDLTSGVVYVHHGGDFDRTAKIDLKEELARGKRVMKIENLFRK